MEPYFLIACFAVPLVYFAALTVRIKTRPKKAEVTEGMTKYGYEISSIELSHEEIWDILWEATDKNFHQPEYDKRVGELAIKDGRVQRFRVTYYRKEPIAKGKLWLVKG